MSFKVNFDKNHNVIRPSMVLMTKSGNLLGGIPAHNLKAKDSFQLPEIYFTLYKKDTDYLCRNNVTMWDNVSDFKLVWVKEWNTIFEIYVDLSENASASKSVTGKALGGAELSQINLYDLEINTESDIEREDYVPSILYNDEDVKHSILNRILDKAPHYTIGHVDSSIAKLQRSFSFSEKTIFDAMSEIAEEIHCYFDIVCKMDSDLRIVREINVYDLENYCQECGERGSFIDTCSKCGSDNILPGYGEDTSIFISTENLADNIDYSTDVGSVKNCFKLVAGDELMTATIANCNPNGTSYLWYIPDKTKEDMSDELVQKLNDYDDLYDKYQNEYKMEISSALITSYNNIIDKYKIYSDKYKKIPTEIIGYPALMQVLYDTIDFASYLQHSLMPSPELENVTASIESGLLEEKMDDTIAVKSISNLSKSTADTAALAYAKIIVDSRYQIKISESSLSGTTWSGKFKITRYSDDEDTATTGMITCTINEDRETYIKQMLEKSLGKNSITDDTNSIVELFNMNSTEFVAEIKKYGLSSLKIFYDACQGCVDVMIEQGVADKRKIDDITQGLYDDLYSPYYEKLTMLEEEIALRENEIYTITGNADIDGNVLQEGIQTQISEIRSAIQNSLNFEEYLGSDLWLEFSTYRREDVYKNENYISDGLDNQEIFDIARKFIDVAKEDIFKSATLQHSISASLSNLLAMQEFSPIVDHFEVGNWIRIRVDDNVYKLRLIEYEIDFDNIDKISVAFSDLTTVSNGVTDVENILNKASDMATSYGFIARQAKNGSESNGIMDNWFSNGLSLTQVKIINSAENQDISFDSHGIACKEYIPELGLYDDKQLKILNKGLYLTDDAWKTTRAAIGDFIYYDPKEKEYRESYGVIADTLVGNLILSEEIGVYNSSGSISMDENGVIITADKTQIEDPSNMFILQKKTLDENNEEKITKLLYFDTNGELVINGSIRISSGSESQSFTSMIDKSIANSKQLQSIGNRVSEVETNAEGMKILIKDFGDFVDDFETYFNFAIDGLYISTLNSSTKMRIMNDKMQILVDNNAVMTLDQSGLNADIANIQSLMLGDYYWHYDSQTGHLTLS